MKKFLSILTGVVLVLSIFSACSEKQPATESKPEEAGKKLKVYTSFYPMYDFAAKIGGDKIELYNLVPAGTEPHDYEPSTEDIAQLESADMLIYNGAGMEHWVETVVKSLTNKNLVVVEASHGIELMKGEHHHDEDMDHDEDMEHDHDEDMEHDHDEDMEHDHDEEMEHDHDEEDHHDHGQFDPHVWLNPHNAISEMENIKNALVTKDPANKDYYEENFMTQKKAFEELDAEFAEKLKPYAGKNIVVAHEAFGYLCKAYNLNQMGIEGLSPDLEPDPKRMAEVVDFVKANNVKTIFFEELVSPKVAETVAKETGAATDMLNPLEGLTEEQLKNGEDYISVMKANIDSLIKSFK